MSSFSLRSFLFLAMTALAAVKTANGCIFCPFLPPGMIPTQCYTHLQKAGECFVERNCQRCLGGGLLNSANRVGDALDFFYMPVEADSCEDLEAPICPLTETCCKDCRGRINSLYRCMVRNSNGMSQRSVQLQRTCALDCQGSSTGMQPPATPAPTVNVTDIIDANMTDTNMTEPDANVTEPVYVAEPNMTDTNMTEPDVVEEARVAALRGADNGY